MFRLNVVTPEKRLVTDVEVEEVLLPAYRGELDIFPAHAPLMTTLGIGGVKYRLKDQSEFQTIVVSWGYAQVHPEGVIVLAETAESLEEIDREMAELALKRSEEMLSDPMLEPDQITHFQHEMAHAFERLKALETK